MSANWGLDATERRRMPKHQGTIVTLDGSCLELVNQRSMCSQASGNHHQPARVLIEAMDDPAPRKLSKTWIMMQQRILQGAIWMPGSGVHH